VADAESFVAVTRLYGVWEERIELRRDACLDGEGELGTRSTAIDGLAGAQRAVVSLRLKIQMIVGKTDGDDSVFPKGKRCKYSLDDAGGRKIKALDLRSGVHRNSPLR
jgi:hypothetical protein